MVLSGKTIHFLGDSITEGAGASSGERCYVSVLTSAEDLAAGNNFGIGGTRIARQVLPSAEAKFDRDFCLRCDEMPLAADAVVVFGGTNDFGHGLAPFGETGDNTPYTFLGACEYLFAHLRQRYPDIPIAVVTPLHRAGEDSPYGDGSKTHSRPLRDYVQGIRQTARRHGLPVLDLFAADPDPLPLSLFPDGLHPNDAGHAILAGLIADFLKGL